MRRLMEKRLDASMTIEASYLIAFTFTAIALFIKYVYIQRSRTVQGFVAHEAVQSYSHVEEDFDSSITKSSIESVSRSRLSVTPPLDSATFSLKKNTFSVESNLQIGDVDRDIKVGIYDPERWMRITSVIGSYVEGEDKDDSKAK